MAKLGLSNQLPYDLIKSLEKLEKNSETMMREMTQSGAEVVRKKVEKNIKKAFKHSDEILGNLKVTKSYKTKNGEIGTKVAVYGYIKTSKKYRIKNNYKSDRHGTYYEHQGLPTDFVVKNREFGNSRGEKKKPIFRTAFSSKDIESEMLKVQEKYLPKE